MVGREVTGDYYRADYGEKVSDEVVLSVKNVTVPGLIEDVTFDLHKGEHWQMEHRLMIFRLRSNTALRTHQKTVIMNLLF